MLLVVSLLAIGIITACRCPAAYHRLSPPDPPDPVTHGVEHPVVVVVA